MPYELCGEANLQPEEFGMGFDSILEQVFPCRLDGANSFTKDETPTSQLLDFIEMDCDGFEVLPG